ncbi:MAG: phosphoribosyltransferase family protein [Lachnospiraceae bacterium]|jgi:adenine phosphoribosyltransferase
MTNSYNIEVCGVKRTLPLIPIDDKTAFASFVIISDTELISRVAGELIKKIGDVDVLVTAEAKGIALTYEMSRQMGMKDFIVARKGVKNYMRNYIGVEVNSITTAGTQHLYLDEEDAAKVRGRRVCLVDDVISTGESIHAIDELVKKSGGNVVCRAAVLAEGDAASRKDIVFLQKLPLFEKNAAGEYEPIQ